MVSPHKAAHFFKRFFQFSLFPQTMKQGERGPFYARGETSGLPKRLNRLFKVTGLPEEMAQKPK
jgi:hypothetical protein